MVHTEEVGLAPSFYLCSIRVFLAAPGSALLSSTVLYSVSCLCLLQRRQKRKKERSANLRSLCWNTFRLAFPSSVPFSRVPFFRFIGLSRTHRCIYRRINPFFMKLTLQKKLSDLQRNILLLLPQSEIMLWDND